MLARFPSRVLSSASGRSFQTLTADVGRKSLPETGTLNTEYFGKYAYDHTRMKSMVAGSVMESFRTSLDRHEPVSQGTADTVATSLLKWAQDNGATHYTHWFQPLTGNSAEKHDTFLDVNRGGPISRFRGKDLIRGEPDGSSFPNGGLRQTHLARGYTVWDVSSDPFIIKNNNGATLYIPSVFFSWENDQSLDDKIPLLRSDWAVGREARQLFQVMGDERHQEFFTDAGLEQEFFLIDRNYYNARPDLVTSGRTVMGAASPKGQELDDHYFTFLSERIIDCIHEYEVEMWKLGVPIQTRHSEVAPGQFEVAPKFCNSSLAVDRNLIMMHMLDRVAAKHGLAALLHEKPFAGVNGSGKHNNWSFGTNAVGSLLDPGRAPAKDVTFMLFLATTLAAVDKHSDLMRIAISGAGNDHRLGANEAPPAIMSAFLGQDLDDAIRDFMGEAGECGLVDTRIDLGVPSVPMVNRDATDRNRTSPFAFTGNKFEFRAVGSSQNPARSCTVLNTALAEGLRDVTRDLEQRVSAGASAKDAATAIAQDLFKKHSRIIFNGDGYSAEWPIEAAKRGLPNLKSTPEALDALNSEKNIELFESMEVLKREELGARQSVFREEYYKKLVIEAKSAVYMAKRGMIPAGANFQSGLSSSAVQNKYAKDLGAHVDTAIQCAEALESLYSDFEHEHDPSRAAAFAESSIKPAIEELRQACDGIEETIPESSNPFPTYHQMLFQK